MKRMMWRNCLPLHPMRWFEAASRILLYLTYPHKLLTHLWRHIGSAVRQLLKCQGDCPGGVGDINS